MTEATYRMAFTLDDSIPLALLGGRILFNGAPYDVDVLGDGPPVPQEAAGTTPQIGTGEVGPTLFTDTEGNGIAMPQGSQLVQILDGERVMYTYPETGIKVPITWGVQNGGLVQNPMEG